MRRIGIMGGTFDPVHNGHLLLGKQAYQEYSLDCIWYMPSRQPPHKRDHRVTGGRDRVGMLSLALEKLPFCFVSTFEMEREGTTYTAQTMRLLRQKYQDTQFFFIIGGDSLYQLETWYHPEEVMALTSLLVAGREYEGRERSMRDQIAYLKSAYGADIHLLHCEEIDISSADIRRRVAEGKSIAKDVPPSVAEYIRDHRLYLEDPAE